MRILEEANEVQENLQDAAPKEQPFLTQQVNVPVKKKKNCFQFCQIYFKG